ncbi:MAG: Ig-like domain-containing protein [Spirochaetaceae bacterium]|jgi:hypothetical protein|nr:Ig-like domain-containing protein [Spirochaetaceae bacterium]
MRRIFCILVFTVLAASCALVSFEDLEISSDSGPHNGYFAGRELCVCFSLEADHHSVERQVSLSRENQSVSFDTRWEGRNLYIRENPGWKNGKPYRFSLNGTVLLTDGRQYAKSYTRYFYYGDPGEDLVVTPESPAEDGTIDRDGEILFTFNKAVNIASFNDNFSLSPYCAHRTMFSDDRKRVTVSATDGWPVNQIITWRLPDLLSDDGYGIPVPVSGRFHTPVATGIPQVLGICPVTPATDGPIYRISEALDGNLLHDQSFGVVFSQPMDAPSVLSAFTMTPVIRGYLAPDPIDRARFLFTPQESYEPESRCQVTISSSARSAAGLDLAEPVSAFWTPLSRFIAVESICFGADPPITAFPARTAVDVYLPAAPSKARLCVSIRLSSSAEPSARIPALGAIQASVLFPSTAASPSLVSAQWNPGGTELLMTWENFTAS